MQTLFQLFVYSRIQQDSWAKVFKKNPPGAYFGASAGLGPKVLKKNPREHKFHCKMASKVEI